MSLLFICAFQVGCGKDEIERLKSENTQQKTRIAELEKQIQKIEDERQKGINIYTDRSKLPSITYWSYEEKKKFVKKDSQILIYPQAGATPIAQVAANAVVEVIAAGATDKLWLYVAIPTYDSPMDNQGWIPEENTEQLTKENQNQVLGDVYINKGTNIYRVDKYEQISKATQSILTENNRGWINQKKEDYVLLSCPGGESFWVAQKDIIYPSLE